MKRERTAKREIRKAESMLNRLRAIQSESKELELFFGNYHGDLQATITEMEQWLKHQKACADQGSRRQDHGNVLAVDHA